MRTTIYLLIFLAAANVFANIDDGLVAHWTFDNDEGDVVADESGNNLHGTAYNVTYEQGPISQAAVFNGENSRIFFSDIETAPPDTINTLTQGSISLWFKFHNAGGMLPFLYYGESDPTRPHNSLIIEVGHGQNPQDTTLYFTIVHRQFCFTTPVGLVEATWYHFTAVVREDGNTGYLNGEEMINRRYLLGSNATYTEFFASITRPHQLSLGYGRFGRNASFFHLDGSLDDVRIYNRPLDADEVRELYEMGFAPDLTEKPQITPREGNYYEPFDVTISTATENATIYYTLDGSDPDEQSPLYEAPFEIVYHTVVKARAYADEYLPSKISEALFHVIYPPQNLYADGNYEKIQLQWDKPWHPDDGQYADALPRNNSAITDDLIGYNVYRSFEDAEFKLINDEPVVDNHFADTELNLGNYRYYITALYQQGESQASNVVNLATTSIDDDHYSSLNLTRLISVHPNPFNPQTTISWTLAQAGEVKLTVYDVRGNLVCTLIDRHKTAGTHQTTFTADELPSGIYFYKLKTAETTEIRKMLLLK